MERNGPSKWNWIICNLPLKQIINGENVTWSLQPSITLSHPTGEGPDPQIKVLLDQEKSFQCTEELGWNWHKSWKLPTISLQLEITDSDKGDALLCPKDIYVHIFAVKALVDSNSKLCLVDVGLRGTNKMELVDGKAIFQTLKFASTSYNNEGVKFHLLMCIYLQISEDTKPKILKAVISPPIFVDSRKSVRENDKMNENKLFLYVEPFYPDNFTRKFVKKETKKKESIEEEIQNSVDGLHSYLTAPNIRNKVKHPIFLCVRFSNCITLFMNPELVREEDKDNLVEFFQGLLFEEIEKGQEGGEAKLQDSFFILYINKNDLEDKLKKKKILELLCPIKCRSLSVVFNRAEVPPSFIPLQDLRGLMELYSKSYSKLLSKSKFCLRGEEENEDEEGPSDRIPPPERQMISFANDTAPRTQNDWNKYFDTSSYEEDSQKRLKNEENANAPMSMMEARTISYRDSMSKLFPNGQDPLNSTLTTPSSNSMQNFQLGASNQLLRSIFQGKGTVETPSPGVSQFPRGHVGTSPLSNMNPGLVNQNGGRFPMARAPQTFGNMDPLSLMMMNNKRGQFPNMNLMGSLGQMGQPIGGIANLQQMMMGKEGDLGNNPERMQAMMQAYQQFQMMQGQGDGGVKAENIGENWNGGDIHVKIQDDDDRRGPGGGNKKRNDINVKDEDAMN